MLNHDFSQFPGPFFGLHEGSVAVLDVEDDGIVPKRFSYS